MHQHYGWGLLGVIFFCVIWFAITRPNVKMLETTPNKLVFRVRVTFFWGVGVFFGGLGLLFVITALNLTPVTTLACSSSASQPSHMPIGQHLASIDCQLVEINWLGAEKSKINITGLRGATVETETETDSHGRVTLNYRVMLFTKDGNVPFKEISESDHEDKQLLSSQINRFVETPLDSVTFQEDDRVLGYTGFGIGCFFGFISLLVVTAFPVVSCTLDKELDSMTISRQKWFREKVSQYPLNKISGVKVESAGDDWMYRVTLNLSSGENLPLTQSYTSEFEDKQYIAVCIRKFLNLGSSQL